MKPHLTPAGSAFKSLLHQMRDGQAPVTLVLDLWSLGHSAGDIARRVGLKPKRVSKIVEQARLIGDKRAVLHCGVNGRLLGRPGRDGTTIRRGAKTVKRKEVAMLIPKEPPAVCKHGHDRRGTRSGDRCLECDRLAAKARRDAKKALR